MTDEFIQDAYERAELIKRFLRRTACNAYVWGGETCTEVQEANPYTKFIELCGTQDDRRYMVASTTMLALIGSLTVLRRTRILNSFRNATLIYVGGSFALNVPQNLNPY